jgi:hypothetical protein
MSTLEEALNNGQQAIFHRNLAKIFLRNNRFDSFTYTNDTGEEKTLLAGTVMGRKTADGEIIPLDGDASDGSQYPIGILNEDRVVADGESVEVSVCVSGDVAEEMLILEDVYDDLDTTIIDGRLLRDRIGADTVGVRLVTTDELSGHDNE